MRKFLEHEYDRSVESTPGASPVERCIASDETQKQLGEDIAFGMQQTLACWATDFIDPYVGKWVQDRFRDNRHQGSLKHTWGGEIVGDSAAFFAFLGMQRFAPGVTVRLSDAVRAIFGPSLESSGKKHLRHWTRENHINEKSEQYRQKLEEWKEFQADNIAKSSVISTSSIVFNVATQKAMGNTHKLSVILISKMAGAAITVAAMLGMRFYIPKTTRQLDQELSEQYFVPLIQKTQKLMGAETEEENPNRKSHVHAVHGRRNYSAKDEPSR